MTKNQRNILELAYINILVDPVLQGDSWGLIDAGEDSSTQEVFDDLGGKIRALRAMSDDDLLSVIADIANRDKEDKEDEDEDEDEDEEKAVFDEAVLRRVLEFESYDELYQYSSLNLDGGDLDNQTVVDVLYGALKN